MNNFEIKNNAALESFEVKKITVDVLEKCIKDLEVDYAKAKEVCEIDRLMVVCIERVIFNMELERDLLASANKANHRKVIRTMRQIKELEGKVTELALDATLKQKLMTIEILKHENKILEAKDQLKQEKKKTVQLKDYAEFNEKVFHEKA